MNEDKLRALIWEKLRDGTLPKDSSFANRAVFNGTLRWSGHEEQCSLCSKVITHEAVTDYQFRSHPRQLFVFHNQCERLWREATSRSPVMPDDSSLPHTTKDHRNN